MIRSLTQLDIPQLMIMENATHPAPWGEESFLQCFRSGYLGWAYEKNDTIIGFMIASLQLNECHILNLTISSDFQRQGFGQALLKHLLIFAKQKGVGMTYLEVRRSNFQAIALYKKMGFVEVTVRKGYYQSKAGNEDAIVFAMDLGVQEE